MIKKIIILILSFVCLANLPTMHAMQAEIPVLTFRTTLKKNNQRELRTYTMYDNEDETQEHTNSLIEYTTTGYQNGKEVCQAVFFNIEKQPDVRLHKLSVNKNTRRMGAGKKIFHEVVDQVKNLGCTLLEFSVEPFETTDTLDMNMNELYKRNKKNVAPTIEFYLKCGAQVTDGTLPENCIITQAMHYEIKH